MKQYTVPHIVSYSDEDLQRLAETQLLFCIYRYTNCASSYMKCQTGFSMDGGSCSEQNYCAKSHIVCGVHI